LQVSRPETTGDCLGRQPAAPPVLRRDRRAPGSAPQEQKFDRVVANAISRRGFLGVLAFGSGAAAMGLGTLMGSTSARAQTASRFAFAPIAMTTDFTVHVPEGYAWKPVARWGDALFADAPALNPEKGITAAGQARPPPATAGGAIQCRALTPSGRCMRRRWPAGTPRQGVARFQAQRRQGQGPAPYRRPMAYRW
jgi:hypothetical protein